MATYTGTAGSETITGDAGDDSIAGEGGADRLLGEAGADSLDGGDGNDWVFGGRGDDVIEGGAGVDVVTGDYGNDTVYGGDGIDSVYGLSGNDTLFGGAEGDTVSGGTGRDRVYGGGGGDVLRGDVILASHADLASTGAPDDTTLTIVNAAPTAIHAYYFDHGGYAQYAGTIAAGASQVFVTGTGFNWFLVESTTNSYVDAIFGAPNQTFTYAQNGDDDTLWGEAGADAIWGDTGNDTLFGGAEGDTLYGGAGADALWGDTGDDILSGDAGSDRAYGGEGQDKVLGGDGNDTLWGDAGDDSLSGDAGHDQAFGGAGADTLAGGAGNDSLYGGTGDDVLSGGAGNDLLSGGSGADTLWGEGGNDTLAVTDESGLDTIHGGEEAGDRDLLSFAGQGQGVTVTFTGTDSGTYALPGGATSPNSLGGPGASGSFTGIEAVSGTSQADTMNAEASTGPTTLEGMGGDDSLSGGSGQDSLSGGDGSDRLSGDAGNDSLSGGEGSDSLSGGAGDDRIDGGAGDDQIATGSGADTVAIGPGGGADRVTDFDVGDPDGDGRATDRLDVSALRDAEGNPVDAWDVVVTDDGQGNAVLSFPGGESVTLEGVAPARVTGAQALWRIGVPCFTAGARVEVPGGLAPVERLRPGDLVVTRDNGPQAVRWVAMRRLGPAELAADPRLRPVRIAPGAFGNAAAALVSPQHGLALAWEGEERLVRARQLARMRGGAVRVAQGARAVTYVHLMFERHQVIRADGLWSESFFPGPEAVRAAGAAAAELLRLFPALRHDAAAYGPAARPYARSRHLPERLAALAAPGG